MLEALSFGLFVGIPFWGVVADRLLRSQRWTILLSLVIQTGAWLLLALAPTAWPRSLLYLLFFLVGFSNGCWMPAYALVRSTSPAAVQATALGLLNFAFFFGAALFQQASGVLLGQFARGPDDALSTAAYRTLFAAFCVVLVLATVCVALSRERTTGSPER